MSRLDRDTLRSGALRRLDRWMGDDGQRRWNWIHRIQFVPTVALRTSAQRSLGLPLMRRRPVEANAVVRRGLRMRLASQDVVQAVLLVGGTWEPNVTAVVEGLLRGGDSFVDVGAHVGFYSLLARSIVGPDGSVVSMEPAPETYARLCANFRANGIADVDVRREAASRTAGKAVLHLGPASNPGTNTLSETNLAAEHGTCTVPTVPLAGVVGSLPAGRPLLMKVDVEGHERQALAGLVPALGSGLEDLALVVEYTPYHLEPGARNWLWELVEDFGFSVYAVHNRYDAVGYFPRVIEAPVPVDAAPDEQCDLVLVRGPRMSARLEAMVNALPRRSRRGPSA